MKMEFFAMNRPGQMLSPRLAHRFWVVSKHSIPTSKTKRYEAGISDWISKKPLRSECLRIGPVLFAVTEHRPVYPVKSTRLVLAWDPYHALGNNILPFGIRMPLCS